MASELLGELFRCDKYQGLFPGASMPVRACLRRQLERIPTKDAKGRLQPLDEWPAPKPYCAAECPVGRGHLERARAQHVPAETCLRCGAAQVGDGSANPCQGCPPDDKAVPRGHLPPPRAPSSERIWSGEVPDVPIGAPGPARPRPVATFEQHEREAAARRVALQDDDQVPAEPAEERTMAKPEGKRTCGVKGCGAPLRSDNKSGVCSPCNRRRKAPGDAQKSTVKAAAPKVTPLRPATPRRAKALDRGLEEAPLAELLQKRSEAAGLVAAVDAELLRRQREIAEVLGQPARASTGGG